MNSDLLSSDSPRKRRKLFPMISSRSLSDLLASFGAHRSPTSSSRMSTEAQHRLVRQQARPQYAESDDAIVAKTEMSGSVHNKDGSLAFASPSGDHQLRPASEDELQGEDVIHVRPRGTAARLAAEHEAARLASLQSKLRTSQRRRSEPAVRTSMGTRKLPDRSSRAFVSYTSPKRQAASASRAKTRLLVSDTVDASPMAKSKSKPKVVMETARNKVRSNIATQTKPKRDAFLLENKEFFLPLLPDHNYIDKLERISAMQDSGSATTQPLEVIETQPLGVQATMKPYQLEGLSFLVHMYRNGMPAILGDEMGLGKTLQTLSLLQWLAENEPSSGEIRPHLVVCPLSVLSSWMAESKKWTPQLKTFRLHGPKSERDRLKQTCLEMKQRHESGKSKKKENADRIDVVVTTYETFLSEQSWLKRIFVWRFCVLDEGHKIKNDKTNISSALQSLSAEYRLLLTGTPLQNNLHEMWSLLHWLLPEVFGIETADKFATAFNLTSGKVSTTFMDDARRLLELVMLRRMKNSPGINLGLPPKEEVLLYVPLTPMQRFWYTRLLTRTDSTTLEDLFTNVTAKETAALQRESEDDERFAKLEKAEAVLDQATNVWTETKAIMEEAIQDEQIDRTGGWQKLMNLLMQLRKVCIHPYILRNAAPEEYEIGEHLKIASGKFVVLDKLVEELVVKQKKKILIFSGFTSALNLVEEFLLWKGANATEAGFRYSRLDGSTARAQRNLSIRLFNSTSSNTNIMLLSTRAGGLGINLTSATDVIFMDEDWNPQVTLQAEARAHRIGQTKKVTIYKLCTQGTVEEQMMGRIRKKLYLSAKITESMRNIHTPNGASKKRKRTSTTAVDDNAPQLDTSSLQALIRRGAQTLVRPEINIEEMLDWDWETTLEQCKDKPIDTRVGQDTQGVEVDEQQWLNTMEKVETAVFEGKSHQKTMQQKLDNVLLHPDISRADRRTNKNTTVMIDGFAVTKESLLCDDWEAVPTLAGKDPRLTSPKRAKKPPIQHQEHCQVCWELDELTPCTNCPRSYHAACLDTTSGFHPTSGMFFCSQHQCRDCGAKTTEAGGLIFRCRWCEAGYCEDCLEWDVARLIGDTLPEFEMLGFGKNNQAYYVECAGCVRQWNEEEDVRQFIIMEQQRIEAEYAVFLRSERRAGAARMAALLTPETVSEVTTPKFEPLPTTARSIKGGKKG